MPLYCFSQTGGACYEKSRIHSAGETEQEGAAGTLFETARGMERGDTRHEGAPEPEENTADIPDTEQLFIR